MIEMENDRLSSNRRKTLQVGMLYCILLAVFFFPAIFQGKVVAPLDILDSLWRPWATEEKISVHNAFTSDQISQFLPHEYAIYRSLREDGYIGWNPMTFNGTAILENTMLSPGDWHHQLYRFLPFWTAWDVGIFIHFAIAAFGMMVLLRFLSITPPYMLIGMVAYGFYSQFFILTCHRAIPGAMCWAPWMVWALLRAKEKRRAFDFLAIVFIALAFRGGTVQTGLYIFTLAILLFLALAWEEINRIFNENKERGMSAWFRAVSNGRVGQLFALFVMSGILGAFLCIDMWVQTIPALMEGLRPLREVTWLKALMGLPTLVTSFFPMVMGTPQGIDVMKAFKSDLFNIKFAGAIALLLALAALFRREAPIVPKVLLLVSLLITFTPLDTWYYSRSTGIYALGVAWLAAWMLQKMATEEPSKLWNWTGKCLVAIVALWMAGSIVLTALRPRIEPLLQKITEQNLPVNKLSRADWMVERTTNFIDNSFIWHLPNVAMLACIGIGIWACSRVNIRTKNAALFAVVAGLATFGEIYILSRTWLTFSPRPAAGDILYNEQPWIVEFREKLGNGSFTLYGGAIHGASFGYAGSDFDYMPLNVPSACGLRQADGYDNVPSRMRILQPTTSDTYIPSDYAAAGISAVLAPPGQYPTELAEWDMVIDSPKLVLYRNPAFTSIYQTELTTGETVPLPVERTTRNTHLLCLPPGTEKLTIAESYNRGWDNITIVDMSEKSGAVRTGEGTRLMRTDNNGMEVLFAQPIENTGTILLQYRPPWQKYYLPIIIGTLLAMSALSTLRWRREQARNSA